MNTYWYQLFLCDQLRKQNSKGRFDFFARKKLIWDGKNIKITNLEEANQFVGREYRKGCEICWRYRL